MTARQPTGFVRTLARSRLPQVLGGYLAIGFGLLQVVDMFVERLGLPDWTFLAMLGLLILGVPVFVATAIVQQRAGADARASAAPARSPASVKPPTGPVGRTSATGAGRWLTWRNALAGGAGSVGVLVVVVAVFMGMRSLGIGPAASLVSAGVLDRTDRILIADFQSQTGDTLLAGAVTEAFRIDFEQSRIVQVVESGTVRDALLRMQRPVDAPLQPDLALELAEREGIKAVMTGEINTAGRTFVLSARLLTADGGSVLVSLRETARDSAAIIAAIDRLSSRMRERIGESLRTIRSGEPLQQVTTSSLAALRKYSQAVRALDIERDPDKGIPLLEEATALDTMFAMAYRKLGVALTNFGEPRERWLPAYTRAFELSERLPDRERYLTRAAYYKYVLYDEDRAIATYRTLLDLNPRETVALNNLALLYADRGDFEQAVQLYERAIAIDSTPALYYTNLVGQLAALGRDADARATLDRYERRFPDHLQPLQLRGSLAAMQGQYDSATWFFRQLAESPRRNLMRASGDVGLASLALLSGDLATGRHHIDRAFNTPPLSTQPGAELRRDGVQVRILLTILADTAGALRMADEALRSVSLPDLDPTGDAHLEIAMLYAVFGRPARGRELLAEYDRLPLDEGLRRAQLEAWQRADAWLSLREGHLDRGLATMRRLAERPRCAPCAHIELANAYEVAADADSAIAHYEEYLRVPWLARHEIDGFNLPRVHERLGQLYDAAGDTEQALYHLARFAELWGDADPELRPRVEAARNRIASLSRRAG